MSSCNYKRKNNNENIYARNKENNMAARILNMRNASYENGANGDANDDEYVSILPIDNGEYDPNRPGILPINENKNNRFNNFFWRYRWIIVLIIALLLIYCLFYVTSDSDKIYESDYNNNPYDQSYNTLPARIRPDNHLLYGEQVSTPNNVLDYNSKSFTNPYANLYTNPYTDPFATEYPNRTSYYSTF